MIEVVLVGPPSELLGSNAAYLAAVLSIAKDIRVSHINIRESLPSEEHDFHKIVVVQCEDQISSSTAGAPRAWLSKADIVIAHEVYFRNSEILSDQDFPRAQLVLAPWRRNLEHLRNCLIASRDTRTTPEPRLALLPYPATNLTGFFTNCNEASAASATTLVLYGGRPRLEDRCYHVLEAIRQLKSKAELRWVILPVDEVEARSLAAEFELAKVEFVIRAAHSTWSEQLPWAHVALHTYVSVHGSPGFELSHSLASEALVVLSDYAASRDLPSGAVVKIAPGVQEVSELVNAIAAAQTSKANQKTRELVREEVSLIAWQAEIGRLVGSLRR